MSTDVQTIKQQLKEEAAINRSHSPFSTVVVVVLGFLLFSPIAMAAKILVIGDVEHPLHQKLIHGLSKELTLKPGKLTILRPDQIAKNSLATTQADLIITLGLSAAKSVNNLNSDTPILFTLLPKVLADNFIECPTQLCPQKRGALFLEQPMNRRLNLIHLLFPDIKKLSFLYGDFSASSANELDELAKKAGYITDKAHIENKDQLSRKFNVVLEQSELFIALPDPLIHNRNSIPQLLLGSYRYNIPIIGFSKSYVSAGAIAAVFSSLEDLTKELTLLIQTFERSGQLPSAGRYPSLYRIQINRNVARSMNLHLPSPSLLRKGLLALEEGT